MSREMTRDRASLTSVCTLPADARVADFLSRAFSRLARQKIIAFDEKGRRDVRIPDLAGLASFVDRSLSSQSATLQ